MIHGWSDRQRLLAPWVIGVVTATVLCCRHVFIYAFRANWQSHYPSLVERWDNNGRSRTLTGGIVSGIGAEKLVHMTCAVNASRLPPVYDPYVRESISPRNLLTNALSYRIIGLAHAVIGDADVTWLVVCFICLSLWIPSLYGLAIRLGQSPAAAVFYSVFIACYSHVFRLEDTISGLRWQDGALRTLAYNAWQTMNFGQLSLMRLPRPLLTFPFLFAASLAFITAAEKKRGGWLVLSGLGGGALAYVYPDVWSSYLASVVLFVGISSVKSKRIDWGLLACAALTAVISLPFLYVNSRPNEEILFRSSAGLERSFSWGSIVYALFFFWGLRRLKTATGLFFACMAAAMFLAANASWILGYDLAFSHWAAFGNIYCFLMLASLLPERIKNWKKLWLSLSGAALFMAFVQGTVFAATHYPFFALPKDYDAALDWLNQNTRSNDVVLALNPEINILVPLYTRNKVFFAAHGQPLITDYPFLLNARRLWQSFRLLGADQDLFIRDLFAPARFHWSDMLAGLHRGEIEKDALASMLFFGPSLRREPLEEARGKPLEAECDYVWYGRLEKQYAPAFPAKNGRWRRVYQNPSVMIYQASR